MNDALAGVQRVAVQRHEGPQQRPDHDWVIDEAPVALVYNGVSHVVMLATPTALSRAMPAISTTAMVRGCQISVMVIPFD